MLPSPAAFRRLCVETNLLNIFAVNGGPAAFRRLCVETGEGTVGRYRGIQPPLGGCVLKPELKIEHEELSDPAAFRRLCVETGS